MEKILIISTEQLHHTNKDLKVVEYTLTALWKIPQSANLLVTGEGVRIGYQRSIHQRLCLSRQGMVVAHHFMPNWVRK